VIVAIVLHAFRCASDCVSRSTPETKQAIVPAPSIPRRLPLRIHLWGAFLPPWPNYGAARMKTLRRTSRKNAG
jgi:hypothetical protein